MLLDRVTFGITYIAPAKSRITRRSLSYQPAFMDSCVTVGHTSFWLVYVVDELVQRVLQPILIRLNGGFGAFLSMV